MKFLNSKAAQKANTTIIRVGQWIAFGVGYLFASEAVLLVLCKLIGLMVANPFAAILFTVLTAINILACILWLVVYAVEADADMGY